MKITIYENSITIQNGSAQIDLKVDKAELLSRPMVEEGDYGELSPRTDYVVGRLEFALGGQPIDNSALWGALYDALKEI